MFRTVGCFCLALLASLTVQAQVDWEAPFPPHRMIDNVWFVGTAALGSYLITTDAGNILINSDFETTVPILKANVEALGFRFEDIKIILGSHAHGDHMEGDALAKQLSGAQVMVMAQDVPLLKQLRPGGKEHPIDRVLHDAEKVRLGNTTLIAHLTPGHTPGCTTWTMEVHDNDKAYQLAIICSYGANDNYVLVDNKDYPRIVEDYRNMYDSVRALPVDVFLASHSFFFDLPGKYATLQQRQPGEPNPYIDHEGFLAYVNDSEARFEAMLTQQQQARLDKLRPSALP